MPLSEFHLGSAPFHRCESHGVWATISFFSRFRHARSLAIDLFQARKFICNTSEAPLKCPCCYSTMRPTEFKKVSGLVVDQCFHCNGIWFDTGELNSIPEKGELESAFFHSPLQKQWRAETSEKISILAHEQYEKQLTPMMFFGLPSEEDNGRTPGLALMSLALVIICFIFSLKGFKSLEFLQNGAFNPLDPFNRLTFLTSIFLHAGWWHLLSNIYFLYICGDNVEEVKGPLFLGGLFFFSALAGKFLYTIIGGTVPSVGASGGVAGLLAFYALSFPKNRFNFLFASRFHFARFYAYSISAPMALFIFLLTQLLALGKSQLHLPVGRTNFMVHIGGIVAGILVYLVSEQKSKTAA